MDIEKELNTEFTTFTSSALDSEKQLSEINQRILIRFNARNAKKGLTSVIGLDAFGFDQEKMKALAKVIQKKHGCASYVKTVEGVVVVEAQGNKVSEISAMLIKDHNISPKKIVAH